jgi:hypothetical protein
VSKLAESVARLIAQNLTLNLAARGRLYRVRCPEYAKVAPIVAVFLAACDPPPQVTDDQVVLDGKATDAALEVLLGDNFGQMLLDGVPPDLIQHAAESVLIWMVRGADMALYHWARWHPDQDAVSFVKPPLGME